MKMKKGFTLIELLVVLAVVGLLVFAVIHLVSNSKPSKQEWSASFSPEEYYNTLIQASSLNITYKFLTLTHQARLIVEGQDFGELVASLLTWGSEYKMWAGRKNQGIMFCRVKAKALSWTTDASIYDGQENLVAKIIAKFISRNLVGTEFRIFDAQGRQIGHSESIEMPFSKFRLKIYDNQSSEVASIETASVLQFNTQMRVEFRKYHNDPNWKRIVLAIVALEEEARSKNDDDDDDDSSTT